MAQRSPQTVKLPNHEDVTFPYLVKRFVQSRPLSFDTAHAAIAKNLLAASDLQSVGLKV